MNRMPPCRASFMSLARGVEGHRDEQALDVGAGLGRGGLELADQVVAGGGEQALAGARYLRTSAAWPRRVLSRLAATRPWLEGDLQGDAALLDDALADVRRLDARLDACRAEHFGAADAGALEQQRGFDRAGADDHLPAGGDVPRSVACRRAPVTPVTRRPSKSSRPTRVRVATVRLRRPARAAVGEHRADVGVVGRGAAAAADRRRGEADPLGIDWRSRRRPAPSRS